MLGKGYESFGQALFSEVDAHAPLPVALLHQYDISQPLRVLDLPDMACGDELLRFIPNRLSSLLIKLSSSLPHWSDLRVHG